MQETLSTCMIKLVTSVNILPTPYIHLLPISKMADLTPLQKDELIQQYVELVVDGMDMDSLLQYAKDGITEYIVTLTDSELKDEVGNFDEDLYDELVDNVTYDATKDAASYT